MRFLKSFGRSVANSVKHPLCILTLILLYLCSCGLTEPTEGEDPYIEGRTYHNKNLGFSVSVPNTKWSLDITTDDPVLLLAIRQEIETFAPTGTVSSEPADSADDVITLSNKAIADATEGLGLTEPVIYEPVVKYIEKKMFAELEAEGIYTLEDNSTLNIRLQQHLTIHNGNILVFTFTDQSEHFDTVANEFSAIINSIIFE